MHDHAWQHVFGFLNIQDVMRLSEVCKTFAQITAHDVWTAVFGEFFTAASPDYNVTAGSALLQYEEMFGGHWVRICLNGRGLCLCASTPEEFGHKRRHMERELRKSVEQFEDHIAFYKSVDAHIITNRTVNRAALFAFLNLFWPRGYVPSLLPRRPAPQLPVTEITTVPNSV